MPDTNHRMLPTVETKLDRIEILGLGSGWLPVVLHVGGHEFWRIGRTDDGVWIVRLIADGSLWIPNEFGGLVPIEDPRRGTQEAP